MRPMFLTDGDNKIKIKFELQDETILHFSASDFWSYDEFYNGVQFQPINDELTEVSIKAFDQSNWISIPVNLTYQDSVIGSMYRSELSEYLSSDPTIYDLKIKVVDISGNYSEHAYFPAFIHGNYLVGLEDRKHGRNQFSINPNPATSEIRIEFPATSGGNGNISIYGINGERVYCIDFSSHLKCETINISSLKKGTYLLLFEDWKGNNSVEKFIKYYDIICFDFHD